MVSSEAVVVSTTTTYCCRVAAPPQPLRNKRSPPSRNYRSTTTTTTFSVPPPPAFLLLLLLLYTTISDNIVCVATTGVRGGGATRTESSVYVTNLNDAGPGSLRENILSANKQPSDVRTVIRFSKIAANPAYIELKSPLPPIQRQVFIDGASHRDVRSDWKGQTAEMPSIVIKPSLSGYSRPVDAKSDCGLTFASGSSGSVVQRVKVIKFSYGITVSENVNRVVIEGCHVASCLKHGILLDGNGFMPVSHLGHNRVLLSWVYKNAQYGIHVQAAWTSIEGTVVGLDPNDNGASIAPNTIGIMATAACSLVDVEKNGAAGCLVIKGCTISGNDQAGLHTVRGYFMVVEDSRFGTDQTGMRTMSNREGARLGWTLGSRFERCTFSGNKHMNVYYGRGLSAHDSLIGSVPGDFDIEIWRTFFINCNFGTDSSGNIALDNGREGAFTEFSFLTTFTGCIFGGQRNALSANHRSWAVRVESCKFGYSANGKRALELGYGIFVDAILQGVLPFEVYDSHFVNPRYCGVAFTTSRYVMRRNQMYSESGPSVCSGSNWVTANKRAHVSVVSLSDTMARLSIATSEWFSGQTPGNVVVDLFAVDVGMKCTNQIGTPQIFVANFTTTMAPNQHKIIQVPIPRDKVSGGQNIVAMVTDSAEYTSLPSVCSPNTIFGNRNLACGVCTCFLKRNGMVDVDCAKRDLSALPSEFPDKTFRLSLASNALTSHLQLAPIAGLKHLSILTLDGNGLSGGISPEILSGWPSLKTLSISSNGISKIDFLLRANLTKLASLDLSQNKIADIPRHFSSRFPRLTSLALQNNQIRVLGANELSNSSQLLSINLNNNPLQLIGPKALIGNSALQAFTISGAPTDAMLSGTLFKDTPNMAIFVSNVADCPAGFALTFADTFMLCNRCPSGTYKAEGTGSLLLCEPCMPGTTDDDTFPGTPCLPCAGKGFHLPAGSTGACANYQCGPGTYDDDGNSSTACAACAEGTFGRGGASNCDICAKGYTDHDLDPSTPCEDCGMTMMPPENAVGACVPRPLQVTWTNSIALEWSATVGQSYSTFEDPLERGLVVEPAFLSDIALVYTAVGLPCGCEINATTGGIHGIAQKAGLYHFRIRVVATGAQHADNTAVLSDYSYVNDKVFTLQVYACGEGTCKNGGRCPSKQESLRTDFECDCTGTGYLGKTCEVSGSSGLLGFAVMWPDALLHPATLGESYVGVPPKKVTTTNNELNLAYSAINLPCGMSINMISGALEGRPGVPGVFNISVMAMASSGAIAEVTGGPFILDVRDCDGRSTCNGGQCIDETPYDSIYSCDCSGVSGTGEHCANTGALESSSRQITETIVVGAAVGGVLVAVLAGIVVYRVRKHQKKNAPFNFDDALAKLKQGGFINQDLTVVITPREIARRDISILETIGEGAFGDVCKGWLDELQSRGTPPYAVAIKTLKDTSPAAKSELLEEAALMASFTHKNVVGLIGVCTRGMPVYLVLPLCGYGSLDSFVKTMEHVLSVEAMLGASMDVSRGCAYLADRSIVHRDIAARNVLVADDFTCKVSDFGMSRQLEEGDSEYYKSVKGTAIPVRWTAPEALEHKRYTQMSDVWAFGVLCYEIFTGAAKPYEGMNNEMVWMRVKAGYRLPRPDKMPEAVYETLRACWEETPADRPTFEDIINRLDGVHGKLSLSANIGEDSRNDISKKKGLSLASTASTFTSSAGRISTTSFRNTSSNNSKATTSISNSIGNSTGAAPVVDHSSVGYDAGDYLGLEGANGGIIDARDYIDSRNVEVAAQTQKKKKHDQPVPGVTRPDSGSDAYMNVLPS